MCQLLTVMPLLDWPWQWGIRDSFRFQDCTCSTDHGDSEISSCIKVVALPGNVRTVEAAKPELIEVVGLVLKSHQASSEWNITGNTRSGIEWKCGPEERARGLNLNTRKGRQTE